MSQKTLMIDYEKCTGCRLCEMVCSAFHNGAVNPSRSRIRVAKWEFIGLYVPTACQHCEKPICIEVCPAGACHRDEDTQRTAIDKDKCIGCKTCVLACPFGGPSFDAVDRVSIKCDHCDGDPQCARFCEVGAVRYVNVEEVAPLRQFEAAGRFSGALGRSPRS